MAASIALVSARCQCRYVKLKHNNGYETAYGHMSALVYRIVV